MVEYYTDKTSVSPKGIYMERNEKIDHVFELIGISYSLDHWTYSMTDGHLLDSSSENNRILDVMFSQGEKKEFILQYGKENSAPLILSSTLGSMWAVFFDPDAIAYPRAFHVIGPLFVNAASVQSIHERVDTYQIPISWRRNFQELIENFPVIPWNILSHYIIMIHYTITGEIISQSDFVYAPNMDHTSGTTASSKMRETISGHMADTSSAGMNRSWQVERTLLNNVRYGNIDYQKALSDATLTSRGVPSTAHDPIRQYQDSGLIFTALCTRAAIEGGLPASTAYMIQNMYIQNIVEAKTLSDIAGINHQMYADFIERVHTLNLPDDLSPQIRECINDIKQHLTEKYDIHQLADRMGYSDYYLTRKFKKEMGISINEYIRKEKIQAAKNLLETTVMSIQDISSELNFCSRSYFTDCFIKEEGINPSEYRKKFS